MGNTIAWALLKVGGTNNLQLRELSSTNTKTIKWCDKKIRWTGMNINLALC